MGLQDSIPQYMADILLAGNPASTQGILPEVGSQAPDARLVKVDMTQSSIKDFQGQRLVLNIFPSIDTDVCAAPTRRFNQLAAGLENTVVACVSRDLPFAQKRFCAAEGIENVITLSDFVDGDFGKTYGLMMDGGPLNGLHSRAVVVIDESGKVVHTEQVDDIVNEPNYDSAMAALG